MIKRFIIALLTLSCLSLSTLALAESTIEDNFDSHGYYTFRQDPRRCASPRCGGIFVKAVNSKLTRCADRTKRPECYVGEIDNPQNLDIGAAGLLKGQIESNRARGFGNVGRFIVDAAFRPATEQDGKNTFVGVENNGIVCITTPCFTHDEYVLNTPKIRALSGLDLTAVGAADDVVAQAYQLLADGGVLLVSGVDTQVAEQTGTGVTLKANQFYLPLLPVDRAE